ncbi:MAG: methyltransferase [Crenarchaeota archaeon]|nr:methyltransferase [Thermoproteota archaeon]
MKVLVFRSEDVPVITYWDARRILDALVRDRELKYVNVYGYEIRVSKHGLCINGEHISRDGARTFLERYVERESEETCKSLICVEDGELRRTIVSDGAFYKLCQVYEDWSPTLMINGIVMHTLLKDPLNYSRAKVAYVKKGYRVLDTCACLGYTAYCCIEKGARYVLSVEIDINVIRLAEINPVSRRVFSRSLVDLANDSILDVVCELRDMSFDYVLHDPPRLMSDTGDLYGRELYREFHRVLKRGGILFHYTGATGSKYRGLNIIKSVVRRLREVGFDVLRVIEGLGVYMVKR